MGKLFLTTGDYILNSNGMDAIVNAANKYMINGSGICGVIYRNAGTELINYCKNTFNTEMENNEVRVTPGFNLNMDILHVLAPKYHEEKEPIEELLKSYKNLLNTIAEKGYKNVLLCSLGTGVHGYKHEEVCKPLIILLNNFCKINDVNIYFNNINPITKDYYLNSYLELNMLNLKDDLMKLDVSGMKEYLKENNLLENNIKEKYKNFIKDRDLLDLCLSDTLMCLQYTLDNFDVKKEQLIVLLERMES